MKRRIRTDVVQHFSRRLRELRRNSKLSQQRLAKKIGVTTKTVLLYEQAKMTPSIEVVARIARLFEVTTDELIFAISKKLEGINDRELVESLALADRLPRREKTLIKDMVESLAAKYTPEVTATRAA